MLTRIGILGLGGWWLFWRTIGESLFRSIEIVFIARGETKKQLQSQELSSSLMKITVFPNIVSDDPLTIESLIILFAQQKTYDIEESLRSLENASLKHFHSSYNGVDAQERISTLS
jgi:hypothetical protein